MKLGTIRLIKELEVADLKGEKVMVDFKSGKYFLLKGIANDLWSELMQDKSVKVEEMIRKIASDYEIEEKDCRQDILKFLERLENMGFIKID